MEKSWGKQSITAELAEQLVQAAAAKAKEIGVPMVIAVVDESGILKAYQRMDGAPLLSVDIAQNKAWTSAAFGMATHDLFDFIKNDPPLTNGIVHTPRFTAFGGGFPLKQGDAMIGAIGLSGGHYTQDMECARAALAVFESM